jgi:predicted NAD/FAD-dependent oxidoreductase
MHLQDDFEEFIASIEEEMRRRIYIDYMSALWSRLSLWEYAINNKKWHQFFLQARRY